MCALYEPYMGPMSAVYEPYMGPIWVLYEPYISPMSALCRPYMSPSYNASFPFVYYHQYTCFVFFQLNVSLNVDIMAKKKQYAQNGPYLSLQLLSNCSH